MTKVDRSFAKAWRKDRLIDPATGLLWARHPKSDWLRALIPTLAARLADCLEREEDSLVPRALSDKPTLEELAEHALITATAWKQFIEAFTFEGAHIASALERAQIAPWVFRAFSEAEPRLRAQFARCKAYRLRRRFPRLVLEEILTELSRSNDSLQAIVLRRGFSRADYAHLIKRYLLAPEWRDAYIAARRAKCQRLGTKLLDADDEALLALGKSGVRKAQHAVHRLRPMRERRAEALQYRAARTARDPAAEALHQAQRRARRRKVSIAPAASAAMNEDFEEDQSHD